MKTLKLRILKIGTNKLQFVKTVKDHTGLCLKDAKEWCDIVMSPHTSPGIVFPLTVRTSLIEFKNEMEVKCPDFEIAYEDKEKQRQIKLIGLGLGDTYDKIQIIAEEFASNLEVEIRKRSSEHISAVIIDSFKDFLLTLKGDQLDALIEKHVQEILEK